MSVEYSSPEQKAKDAKVESVKKDIVRNNDNWTQDPCGNGWIYFE